MTLVRRRHVIYVQGYDPRGFAEYYRLFRTEYRKSCKLYDLDGNIGDRSESSDRFSTTWPVVTEGHGWRVETTYEFLRWEDIIRRDFMRPEWWAIQFSVRKFIRVVFDGTYPRIVRAHWRFGLFLAYPFAVLLAWILVSAAVATAVAKVSASLTAMAALPQLLGLISGCAAFVALLKLSEPLTYMIYILQDAASTVQYAHRQRPDWEERLEAFAGAVIEAARAGTSDEVIIVGHSSGSFLAVDVLTRALMRDPDLGSRGARVTLLTMGANLPIIGFQPSAGWFRDRLAQLAAQPAIDWVDYQSRRDIMNFFPFDPLAGHGIAADQVKMNLRVAPVQFRDIVGPQTFSRLTWHFFDMHFQFLRANELPAAFDYFMIIAGPFSLRTRLAMPADVVAALSDDTETAHAAWDRLAAKSDAATDNPAAKTFQQS